MLIAASTRALRGVGEPGGQPAVRCRGGRRWRRPAAACRGSRSSSALALRRCRPGRVGAGAGALRAAGRGRWRRGRGRPVRVGERAAWPRRGRERWRRARIGEAAAPAPAATAPAVCGVAEHRGPHRKTPTMPEDRAISVSPASTHGIPVAPSAARLGRLRRPIAIIAPQPISPNTPATRAHPLPPGQQRVHVPGQARRRLRRRVRNARREPGGGGRAAAWPMLAWCTARARRSMRQVSSGLGGSGNVRLAVASDLVEGAHAARAARRSPGRRPAAARARTGPGSPRLPGVRAAGTGWSRSAARASRR